MDEPLAKPPPWSQTMTGFLASADSVGVQMFRYWQCSLAGQNRWGISSSPVGMGSPLTGQM